MADDKLIPDPPHPEERRSRVSKDRLSSDSMSLDPTLTFRRGERRHDDRGTTDPAVLDAGRELDRALDRLLAAARQVVELSEALDKFDRALARFKEV